MMQMRNCLPWYLLQSLLFNLSDSMFFPLNDCRTTNIDLLIVFENYRSEFCINSENNTEFISGVLDVFLAPEEENLTRLHVAVASFTSSGPVMYLPFQNGSRQDFKEEIKKLDRCHSNNSPITDGYSLLKDIMTSTNISFQASFEDRVHVKDVVIFLCTNEDVCSLIKIQHFSFCFDTQNGCYENIFFITQDYANMNSNSNFVVIPVNLISHIAALPVFSHAICNQCAKGWFTASSGKDEYRHELCYYLDHHENFNNWTNAQNQCQQKYMSKLAAIQAEEELFFLSSEILNQLQRYDVDKFEMLTIRNYFYLYVYIDLYLADKGLLTKQFPDEDNSTFQTVENWVSDSSRTCGAWLFKFPVESQTFQESGGKPFPQKNRSVIDDDFTQGWVNIPCGQKPSKFALCVFPMLKNSWFTNMPEVSERSISMATQRGEYIKPCSYWYAAVISVANKIGVDKWRLGLIFAKNITSNILHFSCNDRDDPEDITSYSFVCDHKKDCNNGRDEEICKYRECGILEYQCSSSFRCIPIEAMCDLFKDCEDGSDEQFCRHTCDGYICCTGECIPRHWVGDGHIDCTACDETVVKNDESISAVSTLNQLERCVFICNRTQCVYPSQLNDGVVDCQGPEGPLDETIGALQHINKCGSSNVHRSNVAEWAPLCVYVKDRYGTVLGCRDKSHLQDCANFTCPEGYIKCPGSYCTPVHYWGDKSLDCLRGEDEYTDYITGIGRYFKCSSSNTYLHPDRICDGHIDCGMRGEDEINCHVSCAAGFICLAGAVTVGGYDRTIPLTSLDFIDDRTRYLDLSGVDLSFLGSSGTNTKLQNLMYISFANCNIVDVGYKSADAIGRMGSIYLMNLSYNAINKIPTESIFRRTSNLRVLDLSHNKQLTLIQEKAFDGSGKLEELDLSYTRIASLNQSAFHGLTFLKLLNLSHTLIDSLLNKNFPNLSVIRTLDLRDTNIIYFERDTFDGLKIETNLYTDLFSLCCPDVRGAAIPEHTCHAFLDSVSSCTDLIHDHIQRILMWVFGVVALLGNIIVIVYRIVWDTKNLRKPCGMFVTNMGVSDSIMGLYLFIIAGADVLYRDVYVWNDREWRYSVTCKIAGFLSTLSCETSMFFVFLVTLDRVLVIKFPFGDYRISRTCTFLLTFTAWIIGLALSAIPVLPIFDENNIYTSNALCLGLPLTNERLDGWGFSMGVFIVFNFTMFLIIAVGQLMIYRAMSSHRSTIVQSSARQAQEIEVAKTLLLVVLSNFLCWFPIGVMGLSSLAGKDIGREAYAWSAVLVLPVNSALNPLLYTIPVIMAKWKAFKYG